MPNSKLDQFIKNSQAAENENFCLSKNDLLKSLDEVPFVHLPSFEQYKRCEIDKNGISTACIEADWGVANSGTVVIDSSKEEIRLASSLAEHLQVVLLKSKLINTIFDIKDYMKKQTEKDNAYIAFITGASRTADIERILTIGVHGPVKMTVFIIKDL
ncbi:Lactate utilization protein B/C [Flexistipes sinusarabici DSM 4947]|uniref:Lactate utilization protein B/C n=1 Tax=Flexistipes sinusarabici (strain ATCC 49648 / DSM 4947 / MAS 10) TaxID=717231 RepID=F8E470_FLESM|nr:LUD domain-containing protein [Flexistipes sinusarabici]AEI14423.1 Lactate utilization protein B/C [Flexistipes sinusarabici DSM 4947]